MESSIEYLVHVIADHIVHNELGLVFSSVELRKLATDLIVTGDPEMVLRKAIDQAVRISPVRSLKCPLVAKLVAHHNRMRAARRAA